MPAILKDSSIFVLGPAQSPEFFAPLHWLAQQQHTLTILDSVAEAKEAHRRLACAGQVILLARPGAISGTDAEELHALAPLTPLVALVGAWCDGETRSGKPWIGVPRIAWHSWRGAFEQLWGTRPQRRSLWLPRLATDLDRLVAQPPPTANETDCLALVRSGDRNLCETLVTALAGQGWRSLAIEDHQATGAARADVVVWDWSPWSAEEALAFSAARRENQGARFIVLQPFARPELSAEAQELGAEQVLGAPFALADLMCAILQTESPQRTVSKAA